MALKIVNNRCVVVIYGLPILSLYRYEELSKVRHHRRLHLQGEMGEYVQTRERFLLAPE